MKQSKGTWLHAATKRKLVATANFKKSRGGWVAGVEAPLWPQWTAKFEYLYSTSAVSRKLCGRRTVATINVSTTVRDHSLRMGLNYAAN
jgi:opacity protein-like surface antigen